MALCDQDLAAIGDVLSAPDAEAAAYSALRVQFPHLSWTRCDASDVTEEPFKSFGWFDVHLVDTSDHCAQITSDPERATGVVLAKRSTAA